MFVRDKEFLELKVEVAVLQEAVRDLVSYYGRLYTVLGMTGVLKDYDVRKRMIYGKVDVQKLEDIVQELLEKHGLKCVYHPEQGTPEHWALEERRGFDSSLACGE